MCQCSTDNALHRIREYAAAQGWTKSRLAKEAGLQDTTLRKFNDQSWNPTVRVLRRLEGLIPAEFCPPEDKQ